MLRDARHSQGDSVRSALDCQPFCGESLQQQEKAGCTSTPDAIIGDQASPPADLFLSGQQSVGPRWPGKPRPPPISFDAGGGDRVKRQGAKFATCQNRMRQLVRSSLMTRDSWTRHFRQRLSSLLQGPGGDQGRKPWRFSLALCRAPCSNGRTHQSRRSAHVCRRLDDLKSIRTQLASFTALVPASQQQQYSTYDELDWTRLDSRPPTREPRMIE